MAEPTPEQYLQMFPELAALVGGQAPQMSIAKKPASVPSDVVAPVTKQKQIKVAADAVPSGVAMMASNTAGLGPSSLEDQIREGYSQQSRLTEEGISNLQRQIEASLQRPQEVDLSPLLSLTDAWSGSDFTRSYRRPQTAEEKAKNVADLQNLINKERIGVTKDQLDFLQKALLTRNLRASQENEKAQRAEQARVEKGVDRLSTRLEKAGLPELSSVASNVRGLINLDDESDIPGYGQTGSAPSLLLSQKGQQTRQAVEQLRNIILKARSGGAINAQEAQRLYDELGVGGGKTDAQLRTGIKNTLRALEKAQQNIIAGVPKEAVEEYQARGGSLFDFSPSGAKKEIDDQRKALEMEMLKKLIQ